MHTCSNGYCAVSAAVKRFHRRPVAQDKAAAKRERRAAGAANFAFMEQQEANMKSGGQVSAPSPVHRLNLRASRSLLRRQPIWWLP